MQKMFINKHNCTNVLTKTLFKEYNKCANHSSYYENTFREFFNSNYLNDICLPMCPLGKICLNLNLKIRIKIKFLKFIRMQSDRIQDDSLIQSVIWSVNTRLYIRETKFIVWFYHQADWFGEGSQELHGHQRFLQLAVKKSFI